MKFEPKRRFRISDEKLVSEIARAIREHFHGEVPNLDNLVPIVGVARNTIITRFGTYGEAVRRAGFPYAQKPIVRTTTTTIRAQQLQTLRSLSEDDLFAELKRVWQHFARRPTRDEFDAESQIRSSIYRTRFGSWTNAVAAFCQAENISIQGTPNTSVTAEMLMKELRTVKGRRPTDLLTYKMYQKSGGRYDLGTFRNHFGSWSDAVHEVGGITGKKTRYTIDELFNELQRIWEQLGQQPTYDQMEELASISPKPFVSHFGSWKKAILAFCDDRNETIVAVEDSPCSVLPTSESQLEPSHSDSLCALNEPRPIKPIVRVRITGRQPSVRLRFKVPKRDSFRCVACGRSPAIEPGVELHVDHVTAYANGGETVLENLQALCNKCSLGKSNIH